MKNLIFGALFLGLTTLAFAQTEEENEIKLKDVTVSSSVNLSYLNVVSDDNAPDLVRDLEQKVANYDITKCPIYDPNDKSMKYQVTFENSQGMIISTFDHSGKILSTFEKFTNVSLPASVRNSVYKAYPDYVIEKNTYKVAYQHNSDSRKIYKFVLKNENSTERMKLDAETKDRIVMLY